MEAGGVELEKGSFTLIKSININGILEVIRSKGPISRAEVAKITSLTPASISKTTKKLLKIGLLEEIGMGVTTGGRPPVLLKLNAQVANVIGVYLGPKKIELIVSDLDGNIRYETEFKLKNKSKTYILENLVSMLEKVIEASKDEIFGIGIAMNGVVNSEKGVSLYSPHYEWGEVHIEKILEDTFGIPVLVDNDVRAMAVGEGKFGVAKEEKDFVVVNISGGIGAGIVLNGELYNGRNYSAGEIGHIVVEEHSTRRCSCGNYGCLEAVASNQALVEKVRFKLLSGEKSKYLNESDLSIENIFNAALKGDRVSRDTIIEIARLIGKALSSFVNLLNPKLIVIVGELNIVSDLLFKNISEIVKRYAIETTQEELEIKASSLKHEAATIGAVTLVLENLFKGKKILSHKV